MNTNIEACNVWTIMSSYNVEVRTFTVPVLEGDLLADAVYWTLKKEISFDETESIYDFEKHYEITEQSVKKLFVSAYVIPKAELQALKSLYEQLGIKLKGVIISSLAIQNFFRSKHIPDLDTECSHLFIGNEFSRIDIYSRGSLTLTRDVKTGIKSFTEIIAEEFNISFENPAVYQDILTALSVNDDDNVCLQIQGQVCSPETMLQAILPALDRFIRQVERTFSYYNTVSWRSDIKSIFVSSVVAINRHIIAYIAEQLNIQAQLFNPLQDKLSSLDVSEQIAFVPAYAASLSSNDYTPNFIYTFSDKKKDRIFRKTKNTILSLFIVSALICSSILGWQLVKIKKLTSELDALNAQYQSASQVVSKHTLVSLAEQIKANNNKLLNYGKRYLSIASITELTQITPTNISLLYLKFHNASDNATSSAAEVIIEGILKAQPKLHEAQLASYVAKIEESVIFTNASILKKDTETIDKQTILRFLIKTGVTDK